VGKLFKLLRLLGFDTVFFTGQDDSQMVDLAVSENRIILTRDTHIPEMKIVSNGKAKAILIRDDNVDSQIQQVIEDLKLKEKARPFSLCLECNLPLERRTWQQVKDRVPPYVWKTQREYTECPKCHRIYWKGTHWEAMTKRLEKLYSSSNGR
jgi:uncharacterized protein with PIN domain